MSVPGKTYCACTATFVDPSQCNGCDAYAEEYSEDEHVMAVAHKAIDDIQAERIRAAGICVAEARACNRDLVETQRAAEGVYPIRWFYGGTLSALLTQAGFIRERRDVLIQAARKIMGK